MSKNLDLNGGGTNSSRCRTGVSRGLRVGLVSGAALVAMIGVAPSADAQTPISGEVFVKLPPLPAQTRRVVGEVFVKLPPLPPQVRRVLGEVFIKLPPKPAGSR